MNKRVLPLIAQESVLFPGATMPVRLWDPKHRKLAKDVVAGDRTVGVVWSAGYRAHEAPPPKAGYVGCLAKVVSAKRIPNKQIRLVLEGVERFTVTSLISSPEPYVVVEAEPYVDFDESLPLLNTFADEVRSLYERFTFAAGRIADARREKATQLPGDPIELSMLLPSIMSLDGETCQRFLASRSTLMRLRELSALLSPAATSAEVNAEVHVRSRSNGHGAKRS